MKIEELLMRRNILRMFRKQQREPRAAVLERTKNTPHAQSARAAAEAKRQRRRERNLARRPAGYVPVPVKSAEHYVDIVIEQDDDNDLTWYRAICNDCSWSTALCDTADQAQQWAQQHRDATGSEEYE